ncbi:MAG: TonB-dependent receptor [Deltaproteobacteria bacterium]|nr:MAG: TonB-dependent receptor [Deltaproteobacteria bacterium]
MRKNSLEPYGRNNSSWAILGSGFVIIWVFCLFHPWVSFAQGVALTTSQKRETAQLETITVTAQKQEETVQEVPMSISVFDAIAIEDAQMESMKDVADFVPNLIIIGQGFSGWNNPSMRGVYAPGETLAVSTGLYMDGVPVLSILGYDDSLLDVERIEVLRGPQGTLYGKNTEVGAINIITRQPDNEFRGKIVADADTFLSTETDDGLGGNLGINLSGPLAKDRLFGSFSGLFHQQQGFIENITTGEATNDPEHWYGKGHLRWTPGDQLDISLIASYLKYDGNGPNMGISEQGSAMFGLMPDNYRQNASNCDAYEDSSLHSQALKIEYDINALMTITAVTARRVYNDIKLTDYDFSPFTLFHAKTDNTFEMFSQEFRLNYVNDRLKWLVGVYYDNDNRKLRSETISDFPFMAGMLRRDLYFESYAVFANLNFPLGENFNIVGGLRYEYQKGEMKDHIYGAQNDDSWDSISPKLALEYLFSPQIMSYISVSKGFRSGGFNMYAMNPEYYSYDDEALWSYEAGMKSGFLDNRFIVNAAMYYMDIDNMQVNEAVSPLETYVTNAAKATGYGFEVEATARIRDGLSLISGFGYNHVAFDEFKDAAGDYKDNQNPFAPEYTFNMGIQYRHHNGFYFRADLIGNDKMYLDKANTYDRDAYQIVNVKTGYEMERFDIYLYGKNIFDETYDMVGASGGYYTMYSDPGQIGFQLNYRF